MRLPGGWQGALVPQRGRFGDVGGEWVLAEPAARGRRVDAEERGGIEAEQGGLHLRGQRGEQVELLELRRDLECTHGHDLRLRAAVPDRVGAPHDTLGAYPAQELAHGV